MTIKELRDIFSAKYTIECMTRKVQEIKIGNKMLSFFISAAQQDIQRRLSVIESSTTIVLGSDSSNYIRANTYSLPQAFGKHKNAYIGSDLLTEIPLSLAQRQIAEGISGYWFAILPQGHISYILCPVNSGTLTIHYSPDLGYYQPSVSATQSWGSFSGVVYSGELLLPDRYNMAILYNMLSQLFSDYIGLYEKELKSLRESRVFSDTDNLKYNLGGLEEETEDRSSSTSTSTSSVITINALDEPVKRIRVKITDAGSASVEFSSGWQSIPTVVNNISSIVVTSANNEFTNYVHADINQEIFTWTQTGASTITFTPDSSSGWGKAEIIINIYD